MRRIAGNNKVIAAAGLQHFRVLRHHRHRIRLCIVKNIGGSVGDLGVVVNEHRNMLLVAFCSGHFDD